MLQNIRDKFTGGFAIAILALISIPFVFFGINYNFIGTGYAAKINGEEISTFQLENAYQNQLLNYAQLGDLPPAFRREIKEAVLQNLIRTRLIQMYVREEGFRVSDQMIADLIQSAPEFQANGVFSKEIYYNFLEQQVVDANVFEESQRAGMQEGQLQRAIRATAFVTPGEFRDFLNLYGEMRRVAVATFDTATIAQGIEVTEADVSAYYEERPNDFMTAESVDIEYIEIDRRELAANAEITESELLEYYEDSSGRFLQDEQRQARHILIPFADDEAAAEQQATELAARAQAGEPFADLARQYSKDGGTSARGGDLGLILQSQMPGALGDAIFAMTAGEISDPVRSDFGLHIILLESVQAGGALPLNEVRGELERELRDTKADAQFRQTENALSDALFDAVDITGMAEASGLELQTQTGYTRTGGEPFGENQAALDAIFDSRVLIDGEVTDIVELDANRSAVIRVAMYNEAARRTLELVREEIMVTIRNERARAIIQDRVVQLQTAVENGEEFEIVAAGFEADVLPYTVIDRVNEDLDGRVLEAIYRAKKPMQGTPRIGDALTTDGSFAVFSIDAVAPGRPEAVAQADRDARKLELASQSGISDFTAFILQLEADAVIVRSDEALDEDVLFQ